MGLDVVPLVKAVIPPASDADEKARQRWRWNVAYFVLTLAAVMAVHISWACGLLPWVSGFANAADLVRLDMRAKRIEVRLISAELYDARKEQCAATSGHLDAIKPGALRRLNALIADYESMTQLSYRLPECDEF